ncbi:MULTISPECIES: helix-turn-helix transcriptional regulator [unclassified Streptomyces]|uniref:helix-turn-helix transcriptional regulator n=1 Tax=unclassified Streptomyces TaxID=2593676 RepID=UPI002E2FF775|nr:helix-turn-helix transcriptional regulator [Streptomyces sp. NBC_01268]
MTEGEKMGGFADPCGGTRQGAGLSSLASLIGQDETCVDVYRLVITQPRWGIAEIAAELGAAESTVRGCLDKLAELSMLYPAKDATDVAPISPEVGLAAYIHRRETEIHSQQLELAAVRAATAELTAIYASQRARHGNAGLEQLEGVNEVRARLSELARHADSEILAFMPGGAQSPEALEASRPLDEQTLAAGVKLRTIYLDSVRNDRATTEYARWLSELGGEIRTTPSLPLRMLIADRSVALLPVSPEDTRAGAVILRAPGVVTALLALFEMVWESAAPLHGKQQPAADEPTQQEIELLRLLQKGHTDEVAARKLGLSLRTTRRMMSTISQRLGARSRFETGVLAERAGWL